MPGDSTFQSRIDALAYPPTHTYHYDTLTPTGVLHDRMQILERVAPDLFLGHSFLDVGSNKGYFSLRAQQSCQEVVAVEPDDDLRSLCSDLGVLTLHAPPKTGEFDRIFIGNTHHYLYRDTGGWDWVEQIASLSTDMLVIEGPTGMECSDMRCIPEGLRPGFRRDVFLKAMHAHFDMVSIEPAVYYTPDRYVMVFRRKDDLVEASMERYGDYLRLIYDRVKLLILPTDTVVELCCRHDRGVISKEMFDCAEFIRADKDPSRAGVVVDVLEAPAPPCDVLVSTAILHHNKMDDWPEVLKNITENTRRTVVLTGPSAVTPMIGDHQSQLDVPILCWLMRELGWSVKNTRSIGLSEPYCELYLEFSRDS